MRPSAWKTLPGVCFCTVEHPTHRDRWGSRITKGSKQIATIVHSQAVSKSSPTFARLAPVLGRLKSGPDSYHGAFIVSSRSRNLSAEEER
eukprot:scaffold4880_cov106-Cylindrotheca_fusiformis.AAC.2